MNNYYEDSFNYAEAKQWISLASSTWLSTVAHDLEGLDLADVALEDLHDLYQYFDNFPHVVGADMRQPVTLLSAISIETEYQRRRIRIPPRDTRFSPSKAGKSRSVSSKSPPVPSDEVGSKQPPHLVSPSGPANVLTAGGTMFSGPLGETCDLMILAYRLGVCARMHKLAIKVCDMKAWADVWGAVDSGFIQLPYDLYSTVAFSSQYRLGYQGQEPLPEIQCPRQAGKDYPLYTTQHFCEYMYEDVVVPFQASRLPVSFKVGVKLACYRQGWLAFRDKAKPYDFLGGSIEKGELPLGALLREISEETSWVPYGRFSPVGYSGEIIEKTWFISFIYTYAPTPDEVVPGDPLRSFSPTLHCQKWFPRLLHYVTVHSVSATWLLPFDVFYRVRGPAKIVLHSGTDPSVYYQSLAHSYSVRFSDLGLDSGTVLAPVLPFFADYLIVTDTDPPDPNAFCVSFANFCLSLCHSSSKKRDKT